MVRTALALLFPLAVLGCRSLPASEPVPPRELPAFDGSTGARLGWSDVLARASEVEVVVLGEVHKDAGAHAVQLAFAEDLLDGPATALTLEMLERDEQVLVDDYRDGILDAEGFAKETFSTTWAGEGSWEGWYLPIIDAAIASEARVVAANAPRRYVRAARRDGYERLDELGERHAFFDHPSGPLQGAYRDRFRETMIEAHGDSEPSEEDLEALYRSQLVWDATMAHSIARALDDGATRVVHLVGRFHGDFDGGTLQLLREVRPDTTVLHVSLSPGPGTELAEEDVGRGDVVIYTGTPDED